MQILMSRSLRFGLSSLAAPFQMFIAMIIAVFNNNQKICLPPALGCVRAKHLETRRKAIIFVVAELSKMLKCVTFVLVRASQLIATGLNHHDLALIQIDLAAAYTDLGKLSRK